MKVLTIRGLLGKSSRDMRAAVEFIESDPELMAPLHTQTYPLENVEDALRTLGGNSDEEAICVCLSPE